MIAGWQAKIDAEQRRTTMMVDGVALQRQPYGTEHAGIVYKPRCHDCATELGDLHVKHCSVERCPACGGQAISCDCHDD